MRERPYVLLSATMSADGYIDDASATRLMLSDDIDLDRVDELLLSARLECCCRSGSRSSATMRCDHHVRH